MFLQGWDVRLEGERAAYGISITPLLHGKLTNAKPEARENEPFVCIAVSGF